MQAAECRGKAAEQQTIGGPISKEKGNRRPRPPRDATCDLSPVLNNGYWGRLTNSFRQQPLLGMKPMKMKRRGFFRAIAGALLAPVVAKVLPAAAPKASPFVFTPPVPPGTMMPVPVPFWLVEEMERVCWSTPNESSSGDPIGLRFWLEDDSRA